MKLRIIKFCLCQLETSFATNNKKNNIYWNPGYNTLSIYSFFDEHIFDPKINIHTLMKGGRLVNQDISSKEFFKEIDYDKFKKVINFFVNFFNNENKQVKV